MVHSVYDAELHDTIVILTIEILIIGKLIHLKVIKILFLINNSKNQTNKSVKSYFMYYSSVYCLVNIQH